MKRRVFVGHQRLRSSAAAAVAFASTTFLFQQPTNSQQIPYGCAESLIALAQKADIAHGYAARRSGAYCDGAVDVPHTGQLSFLSLAYGKFEYPADPRDVIRVMVPQMLHEKLGAQFRLRLQGLATSGPAYRLDGSLGAQGLSIDRRPALMPLKIEARHLGIRAWHETGGTELFVPVAVGTLPGARDPITLTMRSIGPLRAVQLELLGLDDSTKVGPSIVARNVEATTPFEVPLPRSSQIQTLLVKVTAADFSNSVSGFSFRVLLPGMP